MAAGQTPGTAHAESEFIYHERQVAAICAVHALNSLIQGPAFSEVDLAEIAKGLDERETALLMANGHDNPDLLRMIADGSSNVDDSGNFSIEVIRCALERFNLQLSASNIDHVVQNASTFPAFVLNLEQHWFTIRRIGDTFWNLDSMKKQPQAVSDFFLSAFLSQMRHEGYSIFVVQGILPTDQASEASIENLYSVHALQSGKKDAHFMTGPTSPEVDVLQQLADAVRADPSLHEIAVQSLMENKQMSKDDAETALVVAISSAPSVVVRPDDVGNEDQELAQAIALSLS